MSKYLVKYNRRRGSFTPAVAILLVFFIVVASLVIDYSRFNSAESVVVKQLSNAADVALLDYCTPLKDSYNLYAFTDRSGVRDTTLEYLQRGLTSARARQLYRVKIDDLTVSTSGLGLSDKAVLRQMIVENHSKAFVANRLKKWIERFEVLRELDRLIDLVARFNDIVARVADLEKSYRALKSLHATFVEWYDYAKQFDGAAVARRIADKRLELAAAEEAVEAFKAQLPDDNLGQDMSITDNLELTRLIVARNDIAVQIEEQKDSIRKFVSGLDTLAQLTSKMLSFSDQLDAVCQDVGDMLASLPSESIALLNADLGKVISGVQNYGIQILDELSSANDLINEQLQVLEGYSEEVAQYAALLETLLDDRDLSSDAYANALTFEGEVAFTAIQILMRNASSEGGFSFKAVMDALYHFSRRVVEAQLGYDLGEIPVDQYEVLPSHPVFDGFRGGSGSFAVSQTDKQQAMHAQMDQSTNFLKSLAGDLFGEMEGALEKMIIADYIVTHFSHNYADDEDEIVNNRYLPQSEIEYILNGQRVGAHNALLTEASIYSMRLALNAISILAFKQTELNTVTTEIAALTGGLSYPLVYGLAVVGWSAIESGIDVYQLKQSEKVVFFKLAGDINFDLSLETLMNFDGSAQISQTIDQLNPLAFDYADYLFLLLLDQSEDETLRRIMDMISLSEQLEGVAWKDLKTDIDISLHYHIDSWYGEEKGLLEGRVFGENNSEIELHKGY